MLLKRVVIVVVLFAGALLGGLTVAGSASASDCNYTDVVSCGGAPGGSTVPAAPAAGVDGTTQDPAGNDPAGNDRAGNDRAGNDRAGNDPAAGDPANNAPADASGSSLASTGAAVAGLSLAGVVLLAAGGLVLVAGRRRSDRATATGH